MKKSCCCFSILSSGVIPSILFWSIIKFFLTAFLQALHWFKPQMFIAAIVQNLLTFFFYFD